MRKPIFFLFVAVIAAGALGYWAGIRQKAHADEKPAEAKTRDEVISDLMSMEGVWTAEGENPEFGKYQATIVLKPMLKGQWLTMEHEIKGDGNKGMRSFSVLGWNGVLKKPVYYAFTEDGGIIQGVETSCGKNVSTMKCEMFQTNGTKMGFDEVVEYDGKDEFSIEISVDMGGKKTTLGKDKYTRKK